ncbi:MAG: proliferating cell nuclear antigen (pcna) [Candidatus Hadarchaeales archaeon]
MLRVKTSDSKMWKTCIGMMANLVEEAAFNFSEKGVRTRAMDPSRVALVDLEIPREAFSEYQLNEPTVLGVNLIEMDRVLSRGKSDDELAMELDRDGGRLNMIFRGASTRKLSLPIMDLPEAELPEPKIPFTAAVEIIAGVLQDGLKDAELVGETVRLEAGGEEFSMSSESDKGRTELKLQKGDQGLIRIAAKQQARATYGINYLSNILKSAESGKTVALNFGTDLPMQLDYPIADGRGRLRFLLAPRVEVE